MCTKRGKAMGTPLGYRSMIVLVLCVFLEHMHHWNMPKKSMCSRKWARPSRSAGSSNAPTLTSIAAPALSQSGSDTSSTFKKCGGGRLLICGLWAQGRNQTTRNGMGDLLHQTRIITLRTLSWCRSQSTTAGFHYTTPTSNPCLHTQPHLVTPGAFTFQANTCWAPLTYHRCHTTDEWHPLQPRPIYCKYRPHHTPHNIEILKPYTTNRLGTPPRRKAMDFEAYPDDCKVWVP